MTIEANSTCCLRDFYLVANFANPQDNDNTLGDNFFFYKISVKYVFLSIETTRSRFTF